MGATMSRAPGLTGAAGATTALFAGPTMPIAAAAP